MDRALKQAIEEMGGYRSLARALGISHQAIVGWKRVPSERILQVEKVTGIPREELRPDLYRRK